MENLHNINNQKKLLSKKESLSTDHFKKLMNENESFEEKDKKKSSASHSEDSAFSETGENIPLPTAPMKIIFNDDEEKTALSSGPAEISLERPVISLISSNEKLPPILVKCINHLIKPIMTIVKDGITKTEVIIQSKTLSEVVITIDHYDTAPHSFNIHFSGNEKAQKLFIQYQDALTQNLQKALPNFHCNLFTPTFRAKNTLVKSKHLRYSPKIKARNADERF